MAATTLAASPASAATVTTVYTPGDLFVGFRSQDGAAATSNTLAVNIGGALNYIPTWLGGAASGTFNITFGVIPGTSTVVNNLSADLSAVFSPGTSDWALNPEDGSGVSWAVLGFSSNCASTTPVPGLTARSIFLTVPRLELNTLTTAPDLSAFTTFGTAFNSFASGASGNAYAGRQSTQNSSKAYAGTAAGAANTNNWGTRIGAIGSTFGSGINGEQPLSGPNSGPTNSVLDLWLSPNAGSTLVETPTYLGSFSLGSNGELSYTTAVPEPGSAALLGLGAALLGFTRRRPRSQGEVLALAE